MRALLKIMESWNPTPEDFNALLVATRDLKQYFKDFNGMQQLGVPETGDIITSIDGEPYFITKLGEYTMKDLT